MKLDSYFEEIEKLSFQIQFSVLSGLSSVEYALSRDETVRGLLSLLEIESDLAKDVCRRIRDLLPRVSHETKLSYDESIVAYLYCLNKVDLLLAYRASTLIWNTEGLLWSRWKAFKIIQLVQQVEQSLDVSSVDSVSSTRRTAEDNESIYSRSLATKSAVTMAANPDMIGSFAVEISTAAQGET
ncbi:MAG: hypothetical protein F4X02_10625 [Chloroflexi bacterium]|nr:hypothetical protein [Chloroflexota bacterium]